MPELRVTELATSLVRYDAMCQAIDAAYQVDEVKNIRDRAVALEHYSRLANNVEAERQCCEIRLRAERRAGNRFSRSRVIRGREIPPPWLSRPQTAA